MASLDNLTDGEIRVKLTELGYPVGPITATTKKVLIKKLKYLLDQSKSGNDKTDSQGRLSLSRYSSGDESEDDRSTRNRKSMPPPPKSTVKRRSMGRRTLDDNLDDSTVSLAFSSHPPASSTLNSSDIGIGLLTSDMKKYSPKNIKSQSDQNKSIRTGLSAKHKTSPDYRETDSISTTLQSHLIRSNRKTKVDPFDTGSDTDGMDDVDIDKLVTSRKSSDPYPSFIPSITAGLGISHTRARFQPQASSVSGSVVKNESSSKYLKNDGTNNHNSPFSSDFVRRLSAASSGKPGGHTGLSSKLLDVKESDDEDVNSSRTQSSHHSSGHLKRGGPTSTVEGSFWKSTSTVSRILLCVFVLFFCGLGVVYLNMRFKETPITSSDINLPVCKMAPGDKPGGTCILETEVQATLNIFRDLYQVLHERAVQHACVGGLDTSALQEEQLSQILVAKSQVSVWDIEKHFGNMKVLIKANPQWGVEVKEKEYNILSPTLPLLCYILSFFYGVVGTAVRLIVALVALFGLVKGFYWWQDRQERSQKEIFKLVESIIDILSNHQQSSAKDNYLAISHVRDQLISPHQRDKMAPVWEKAVAYLEENESRVRTEVQQMMGEEFRVWRWLPAPRFNGKRKVWQGQAFETMEGSVNSLPISPTPCLKIRHMFDCDIESGEDWMTRVQDAILEKCEGVNVLHVAVDKNSNEGCVYVKCGSPQDAGRAYRALHGSWFDSKLVTVKYLRLERYHERFPEAARCIRPLRPSNDRKLSLQ